MAIWKKVIVSGSNANLAALQVDNLTSGSVVIGGGTAGNLFTTPINGTGNIVATTGATGLSASGSFSGSFQGSFSGVATLPTITQAAGIVPFTYDGSTAVTVAVSGAAALSNNTLTKWNGNAFVNTNIIDTGTQIQIGAGASSGVTVAAGGINVTGNSTFNSNLTVQGDLVVNGTASFVNSDNLYIKDKFILINSGSGTLGDSGIISQYNAAGSGSALFIEAASAGTYGRWAVAYDVVGTSTSVSADEYMVTAKINQASAPSSAPVWGNTASGMGNLWVTTAGDIYIYA